MTPAIPTAPKPVMDLEAVLQQLISDHRLLLKHLNDQQAAIKVMDLKAMEQATHMQEAIRLRINTAEQRRRMLVLQIARAHRIAGEPKIPVLADLFPARRLHLLKLRGELIEAIANLSEKNFVASKLAGALLGHLNTAVRLIAGAVEHAGLYTKRGVAQVNGRIGVMEAVG